MREKKPDPIVIHRIGPFHKLFFEDSFGNLEPLGDRIGRGEPLPPNLTRWAWATIEEAEAARTAAESYITRTQPKQGKKKK